MRSDQPIHDATEREQRARRVRASRYRQAKVTFTQETSGRCSVSIYAKGLSQAWDESTCVARYSYESIDWPILSTEDVLLVLHHILSEQLLPQV